VDLIQAHSTLSLPVRRGYSPELILSSAPSSEGGPKERRISGRHHLWPRDKHGIGDPVAYRLALSQLQYDSDVTIIRSESLLGARQFSSCPGKMPRFDTERPVTRTSLAVGPSVYTAPYRQGFSRWRCGCKTNLKKGNRTAHELA